MLCLVTKSKLRVVRELTEKEADAVQDLLRDGVAELALAVLREGKENDLWLRCDSAGSTSTTIPLWHRAACRRAPGTRGAFCRAKTVRGTSLTPR